MSANVGAWVLGSSLFFVQIQNHQASANGSECRSATCNFTLLRIYLSQRSDFRFYAYYYNTMWSKSLCSFSKMCIYARILHVYQNTPVFLLVIISAFNFDSNSSFRTAFDVAAWCSVDELKLAARRRRRKNRCKLIWMQSPFPFSLDSRTAISCHLTSLTDCEMALSSIRSPSHVCAFFYLKVDTSSEVTISTGDATLR